ncbi:hypothetical protein [Streptomyces mirabilis]|uniref:hypothetical protein n=1 Tax=Streptomyces mirabilis TaxID=68239 RepID=UPI0036A4B16E
MPVRAWQGLAGGALSTQAGSSSRVRSSAMSRTPASGSAVRPDHVDEGLVGQWLGPDPERHPGPIGEVGADEPLRIVDQSYPLGRIDVGIAGEEAAGVRVGVLDHRVHNGVGQDPVPAQHHPYRRRTLGEQPQQDVLRGAGVERQPGRPPRGQVGFLPYPLRRLHHAQ